MRVPDPEGHIPRLTERILNETEFKEVCDALLRAAVSPLVVTYAAKGPDGGVDAEFVGEFGGVVGRWIFQFKFRHPSVDQTRARARLLSQMIKSSTRRKCEAKKMAEITGQPVVGYVLLTNVECNPRWMREFRSGWQRTHSNMALCLWDRSALEALFRQHPHLLRSRSELMTLKAVEFVRQVAAWCDDGLAALDSRGGKPLFPLVLSEDRVGVEPTSSSTYGSALYAARLRTAFPNWVSSPAQFYAQDVAFPRAMAHQSSAMGKLHQVARRSATLVEKLRSDLLDQPWWPEIADTEEIQGSDIYISYSALCRIAGHGPRIYRNNSKIQVGSRAVASANRDRELVRWLDEHVSAASSRWNVPLGELRNGRSELASILTAWRVDLWYPMEIQLDALTSSPAQEALKPT